MDSKKRRKPATADNDGSERINISMPNQTLTLAAAMAKDDVLGLSTFLQTLVIAEARRRGVKKAA